MSERLFLGSFLPGAACIWRERSGMGAKILVADDSKTIQTAIRLTFSREDVELIPAESGEEAIRKARELGPDLMLIDTVMSDTSGYEICRALKAHPAMRDVPVILLASSFEEDSDSKGRAVEASDIVTKPFDSQMLIDKVKQLLDARPVCLSVPRDTEAEVKAMEVEPFRLHLEEAGPTFVQESPMAGLLTPAVTPPPLLAEPPVSSAPRTVELPAEVLQPLFERAAAAAAFQVAEQVAKEISAKLFERIEQIVREIVPTLTETLIVKEIERIKALIDDKTDE
jgi:CheY-like chemotaxis protein